MSPVLSHQGSGLLGTGLLGYLALLAFGLLYRGVTGRLVLVHLLGEQTEIFRDVAAGSYILEKRSWNSPKPDHVRRVVKLLH